MRRVVVIVSFVLLVISGFCITYFTVLSKSLDDSYEIVGLEITSLNETNNTELYSVVVSIKMDEPDVTKRILISNEVFHKINSEYDLENSTKSTIIKIFLLDEFSYNISNLVINTKGNLGEAFIINGKRQYYIDEIDYKQVAPSELEYELYLEYQEYLETKDRKFSFGNKKLIEEFVQAKDYAYDDIYSSFKKVENWINGNF